MSRVFLATDTRLERQVVVKVLSPELAAGISAERFAREIKLAAQLQEPHIVPVLADGVTADGLPYYTMPFVSGASLREKLSEGALSPRDAVRILRDVAQALAYAHRHGVVHRDIKPENVLLSSGTAVVTDFGIAKAVSASKTVAPGGTLTQMGTSLGTPAYMAPEQVAGDPTSDHRVDLYAWGVMAYELLAGRHPFADKTSPQQLMAAHLSETPAPLPARVPAALAKTVMQALEKEPAKRPASADALVAALDSTRVDAPGGRSGWTTLAAVAGGLVLLIGAYAVVQRRGLARGNTPPISGRSVAVIPLANVGGDTANAYFVDGLTDELTSTVAKLPELRVVGGMSTALWKNDREVDARDVGKRLQVDQVLTGSVRRAGSTVRVIAQLTSTADARIVWTETYDGNLADVFALQADIARRVATGLRITLGAADSTRLARGGTRDTIAHELYLRARVLHTQYGEANLRQAIALYRKATDRDPNYAEAWVGEGIAWFNLADEFIAPKDAAPHALEASRKALAVDSTHGGAQILLAMGLIGKEPMKSIAERAARAAKAAPNDAFVHLVAGILVNSQDPAAAAALEARGRALDPLSGLSALGESLVLTYGSRTVEAERAGRDAVTLAPDLGLAHAVLGMALLKGGRNEEALASFELGIAKGDKDFSYAGAGRALARLGRTAEARRYLTMLETDARTRYVIGDWVAKLCLELGDRAGALSWLERAAAQGSNYTTAIDVDTDFVSLRGDPRFEAVRRKMGLSGDPR